MISGTSTGISLSKQDLQNQRIPAVGFQKTYAAHKATAGQSSINLTSLTLPPEMAANGFTNPSTATLQAAHLLFYRKNLTITSSLRGRLIDQLSYTVATSTSISLLGFTASEGEIFTLNIDYVSTGSARVVGASITPASGTIAIGTTDFNTGTPFKVAQNSSSQVGAVLFFVDGVLQTRNTGNSSTTLDGNYYEVDAGGGLGVILRLNQAATQTLNVLVISNGILYERPDGSMLATIENVNGQLQNMAAYVAAATGQTTTTVLGAAPSNVDLKAFGDRVFSLEQNRARIDAANTFTAPQIIPNISGPTAIAGNTSITGTETVSGLLTATGGVSSSFYSSPTTFAVSVPTSTATTVFTFTANANPSLYLVFANIGTVNQAANYGVLAYVVVDGTTARIITTTNPSAQSLALSGLNLQCTQGSGVTQTVFGSITRLY